MGLKIIKSSEPIKVERLNLCLYAPPGIGKTSLAYTAESPLLLDFDSGAHRAIGRKDTVRVSSWGEVVDIGADDLTDYRTLVVDTAGRALDILTEDIIRRDPKAGRGGVLTLQGYGKLKGEFVAWLKMVNAFGLDVILIAHMDEQRKGDEVFERLDVQGGSKNEIYKVADAMGKITINAGKRWITFDPTDASFGKNPGQLEAQAVPHPDKAPGFLAGLIQQTKDRLNVLTAEQAKHAEVIERWRGSIQAMDGTDDFNAALAQIKKEPKAVQSLFADAAKAKGYAFDKEAGEYKVKEAA